MLLVSAIGFAQNKLDYGLILGADRIGTSNETNRFEFELGARSIPKFGVFIEKKLNEKFTHNLSFTYHQYYQKFINIRRDREGNNPQPFILEAGPFKYFDLGYTLKYRLLNNLNATGGAFFSYARNGEMRYVLQNTIDEEDNFVLDQTKRGVLNGGLNVGVSYELNPTNRIIIEPFSNLNFTVLNREKFILNTSPENTVTMHKLNKFYFSFGVKLRINRNK